MPYITAQCAVALLSYGHAETDRKPLQQAVKYLRKTRLEYRENGSVVYGWPYYVRNKSEQSYPVADITGWAIVAESFALRKNLWPTGQEDEARTAIIDSVDHLLRQQAESGGFVPIAPVVDSHARTYTTTLAAWALAESMRALTVFGGWEESWVTAANRAIAWLWDQHRENVGFTVDPVNQYRPEFYPGLHGQCLYTLIRIKRLVESGSLPATITADYGEEQLLKSGKILTDWLNSVHPQFNHYNETIDSLSHLPLTNLLLENTRHLWGPWTFAALHEIAAIGHPNALEQRDRVAAAFQEYWQAGGRNQYGNKGTYELAEALYCFAYIVRNDLLTDHAFASRIREAYIEHPLTAASILKRLRERRQPADSRGYTELDLAVDLPGGITDQNHMAGIEAVIDTAPWIAIRPGVRILDIGSGLGGAARLLAHLYGSFVVGVELTESRYDDSLELTRLVGLQGLVQFHKGDFLETELPAASFDGIILLDSFSHFSDKARTMRRCVDLCRPEGRIVIQDCHVLRQPGKSEAADFGQLSDYWNAFITEEKAWTASVTHLVRVEERLRLDIEFRLHMERLLARSGARKADPVAPREIKAWKLALELVTAGVIGYARIVVTRL